MKAGEGHAHPHRVTQTRISRMKRAGCVWTGVESTSSKAESKSLGCPQPCSLQAQLSSQYRLCHRDPPLSVTRRCHRVPAARGRAFSAAVTRGPHELRGDVLLDPRGCDSCGQEPTLLADPPLCFRAENPVDTDGHHRVLFCLQHTRGSFR